MYWIFNALLMYFMCVICQDKMMVSGNYIAAFDDSIIFQLKWPGPRSPRSSPSSEMNYEIVPDEHLMLMTSVDNENYQCILPSSLNNKQQSDINDYQGASPLELLKPLFTQIACSYRLEPFWTYELCHGRFLRQYHEDNTVQGKVVQEYYLGKYDSARFDLEEAEFRKNPEKSSMGDLKEIPTVKLEGMELPYWTVNMTEGTLCDLNGQHRFARILYVCHEEGKHEIYSLKETSSCEYEVIILSPLLCEHPFYRMKSTPETNIYCHSIGNSPLRPTRLTALEEEAKKSDSGKPDIKQDDSAIVNDESHATLNTIKNDQNAPYDLKLIEDLLNGEYCLHGGTGWWKYEFCYGKKVEQYHDDDSGTRTTILLGVWNIDKHLSWITKYPQKRPKKGQVPKQVSHFYTEGSFCEDTGRHREVEVKLKTLKSPKGDFPRTTSLGALKHGTGKCIWTPWCKEIRGHPNIVSLYLLEPKTCEYILTVESPIICALLEKVGQDGLIDKDYKT